MLADIFGPDLLIVAIVLVVLLFGGAAIPKLARNLGSAKNQFEEGMKDSKEQSATGTASAPTSAASDAPAPTAPAPTAPAPAASPAEEKSQGS